MSVKPSEIKEDYFHWLLHFIDYDQYRSVSRNHQKLLCYLFERDFSVFYISSDAHRAKDGIELRYQFVDDCNVDSRTAEEFFDGECSVLEMMIALAIRCETHIMGNASKGNQTGRWFWGMVENLGLIEETDRHYRKTNVSLAIDILLARDYEPDGTGGLFTVPNAKQDLRNVEIWYQMCWYLSDILKEEL